MDLSCIFQFAASHFLTKYHGKCENLHGHNYKLVITIRGEIKEDGMVMDFKILKDIVKDKIINIVDHTHLNDLMDNPSAENMLVWIWAELKDVLPLKKLALYETENYYCEYSGE
ncbi:MAG: 6-carboxytetrahydropterin synthase QueD [Patescibacteria group bacterium]